MAKINDKHIGTPKEIQQGKIEALQKVAVDVKKKYKNKKDKPERLHHAGK